MSQNDARMDRREFLNKSATVLAAGAAFSSTASSYGRILGANDRISLGHIGFGIAAGILPKLLRYLQKTHNVEMTAVCDLWSVNREAARATNEKYYGRSPRAFQNFEDILGLTDLDAVLISTPEHSHSPILQRAVEAKKDVYVEKPMGNVLAEVKAARDAVLSSDRIVQVGTQHRSEPYQKLAYDVFQSGTLGDLTKIEIVWNYHGPRAGVDARRLRSSARRTPIGSAGS